MDEPVVKSCAVSCRTSPAGELRASAAVPALGWATSGEHSQACPQGTSRWGVENAPLGGSAPPIHSSTTSGAAGLGVAGPAEFHGSCTLLGVPIRVQQWAAAPEHKLELVAVVVPVVVAHLLDGHQAVAGRSSPATRAERRGPSADTRAAGGVSGGAFRPGAARPAGTRTQRSRSSRWVSMRQQVGVPPTFEVW